MSEVYSNKVAFQYHNSTTDVYVTLRQPWRHKHGVSIQSSKKLGKTFLRITREWKLWTAETLFLAKLFIYLSSIISLIRDFIYEMVTIFSFDHVIGENQQ